MARSPIAVLIVTLLVSGALSPAFGQTPTPTPEQIRMFQSLPPEQQRALLQQLGLDDIPEELLEAAEPVAPGAPERQPPQPETRDRDRESPLPVFGRREPPKIAGGDTVLLNLRLPDPPPAGVDRTVAERFRDRAMAANPYRLDKDGQLRIPGIPEPIALAGLTATQATERLQREPRLAGLETRLTLLSLEPTGVAALKPFGYDLFENPPSTFAPVTDVPVPADYTVGPGDTVKVQLIGNTKANYSLVIGRDGEIRFPDLGPITVTGLTFDEMRERVEETVAEQMIGTRAIVSLGRLRSLRVMVTGDVRQPGSYTVGGLSTVVNALLASGGIKPIGSLRNVQLKRDGKVITTLDLYDLLLRGDSSRDARILSGDVIFIPPVGQTAGVTGEIRRPAIYEFRAEATAGDLIALGGGLTAEAAPRLAKIERIDRTQGRVLVNVDLTTPRGRGTRLQAGDVLHIQAVRPTMADSVAVAGHVYRAGASQFRPGLRLTDVIPSVEELKPNADLHYVLIRRELPPDRRLTAVSVDMARAWASPGSDADPVLYPRDQIIVFDLESPRSAQVDALLADLRRQGTRDQPAQIVSIDGSVRKPGEYPLEAGMTVSDLVRAGGSLDEAAFGAEAEVARYEVVGGQTRRTALIKVDLAAALAGDAAADIALQPHDLLTIRQVPQWGQQESVLLEGEVRFPGRYAIQRGETLAGVLRRAGGLTDLAFVEGVVFTRENLREREGEQIAALTDRLERDLAALALQTSQAPQALGQSSAQSLSVGQSLLAELRGAEPVGRLAIDLPEVLRAEPGSHDDILLKNNDRLVVPRRSQEVTVIGEVQTVTSHLYQPQLNLQEYINLSGGLTQKADKPRIYVVRANGQVTPVSGSRWFPGEGTRINPGDTIVVPVDTERLPPLPLWTSVTSIIYNLAVAVAAVNSF